jgi:glutaredoxin-like protein NrdH
MPTKNAVVLYALSTCVWCKKTKRLLAQLGVEADIIDVDLLSDREREKANSAVNKWNPDGSFPVLVVNNQKAICGFDEEKILEEFS